MSKYRNVVISKYHVSKFRYIKTSIFVRMESLIYLWGVLLEQVGRGIYFLDVFKLQATVRSSFDFLSEALDEPRTFVGQLHAFSKFQNLDIVSIASNVQLRSHLPCLAFRDIERIDKLRLRAAVKSFGNVGHRRN